MKSSESITDVSFLPSSSPSSLSSSFPAENSDKRKENSTPSLPNPRWSRFISPSSPSTTATHSPNRTLALVLMVIITFLFTNSGNNEEGLGIDDVFAYAQSSWIHLRSNYDRTKTSIDQTRQDASFIIHPRHKEALFVLGTRLSHKTMHGLYDIIQCNSTDVFMVIPTMDLGKAIEDITINIMQDWLPLYIPSFGSKQNHGIYVSVIESLEFPNTLVNVITGESSILLQNKWYGFIKDNGYPDVSSIDIGTYTGYHLNTSYSYIWYMEDDVSWTRHHVICQFLYKYSTTVGSGLAHFTSKFIARKYEDNVGWPWWQFAAKVTEDRAYWSATFNVIFRISTPFLQIIGKRRTAETFIRFHFFEAFFATVARINGIDIQYYDNNDMPLVRCCNAVNYKEIYKRRTPDILIHPWKVREIQTCESIQP